jgi:hypothetical protein
VIRGKNEECVSQEFVRPRPEVIESPMPLEDFRDFGDGDEVRRFLFERIESDRHDGIGGIDEDKLVAQVTMLAPFAGVDRPQEKRRGIAVQVEVDETAIFLDVLLAHVAQEVAFAAAGLPDDDHVPHALAA